tara:strand:+ start:2669 stop:4189 length:1521 start_codon:yes stop_codon:yes gene_type:complete
MSGPITPPLTVETLDGATTGRPITTIKVSNGDLTVAGNVATIDTSGGGGGGSGTVTSISIKDTSGTSSTAITTAGSFQFVGAGTTTTAVTGTVLTITSNDQYVGTVQGVSSGGAPLDVDNTDAANPVISMTQSDASVDGWLSDTDWNTFNNKQATLSLTTIGTSGAATLVGSTLNIPTISGGTGTIGGTATVNQVSYGQSANTITSNANLTFDGTNLSCAGYVEVGTKLTTTTGTDLILDTVNGTNSGAIVINDGVDGQISITPNGAGTIKLDGVELDNTAIATGYVLKATSATAAGWATEGGGGSSVYNPVLPNTDIDSTGRDNLYMISRFPPWGSNSTSTSSTTVSDSPQYRPFVSPRTGDILSIVMNVSSTTDEPNYDIGIYSDSDGIPDALLGKATAALTIAEGTGTITLTPSSTITTVAGTQYHIGWVRTDVSGAGNFTAESNGSLFWCGPISPNFPNLATLNQMVTIIQSGTDNVLPASVVSTDCEMTYNNPPRWGLIWS